jgi:hypothetical protein
MKAYAASVSLALVAVLATTACSAQDCGASNPIMTGERVGALRIGMPADSIPRLCQIRSDSTEQSEGLPVRAIRIPVPEGTLRVWLNRDVIYNVLVETPHFRTPDSIRVGSPIERLLRYADLQGGTGEGGYFLWTNTQPLCGLSFEIEFPRGHLDWLQRPFSVQFLTPFATSARVRRILLRQCFPGH